MSNSFYIFIWTQNQLFVWNINILFSLVLRLIKGSRVAMPLCRVALQSPAGAARGQVLILIIIN